MYSLVLNHRNPVLALLVFAAIIPVSAQADRACTDRKSRGVCQATTGRGDLAARCEALAVRYKAEIVVDPDIATTGVEPPGKDVPLTGCLDNLARQIPHAAWRRLYVNTDSVLPTPAKLAASVRALETLPQRGLLLENLEARHALWFLPKNRVPAAAAPPRESERPQKEVYLFYSTEGSTDGLTAGERLGNLQEQYLDLLSHLPVSERPNPAQDGMRILQEMDAASRESFMRKAYEAGMQAWQNADPSVKEEMVQQFVQTVQGTAAAARNPGNDADAGAGERALPNYFADLRRITEAMARRYHTRIVLDPDLWLADKPSTPPDSLPLDQALDVLTQNVKAMTWRRLYYKDSTAGPPLPRDAVVAVRALEQSYRTDLGIEGPTWQGRTLLQEDNRSVSLPELLRQNRFAAMPLYVLYARNEGHHAGSSTGQHLAELQRRQADLLIHMNTDQLAEIMMGQVEQYSRLGATVQSNVMHLPISAILMAVWMPRKALENGTAGLP